MNVVGESDEIFRPWHRHFQLVQYRSLTDMIAAEIFGCIFSPVDSPDVAKHQLYPLAICTRLYHTCV